MGSVIERGNSDLAPGNGGNTARGRTIGKRVRSTGNIVLRRRMSEPFGSRRRPRACTTAGRAGTRSCAGKGVGRATPSLIQQLLVVTVCATRFGLQDELPRLMQNVHGDRQVIASEAGRGLELVAILVGALQAHLMEFDVAISAGGVILEHAGGNPSQTKCLHRFLVRVGVCR